MTGEQLKKDVPLKGRKGAPAPEFLEKNGLNEESKPQDWSRAFLPVHDGSCGQQQASSKFWMSKWAKWSNEKAQSYGAGQRQGMYPDWVPFTHEEIEKNLAIYIIQGLNPSPQLEMKFVMQESDPIQGNDLIYNSFAPKCVRKLKHFKAFFSVCNPLVPTPSKKSHPNFKVDNFLRHIDTSSREGWLLGENVSIDEQTIGFQGRHADKQRITYKKEGDGFQCDAVCDSGFTFSFYFRNQPAPDKYIKAGFSPLHSRVMALFDKLKEDHHNVWFDNLYLSARFAKGAYLHDKKVKISGPTRKSGRGLPAFVLQEEKTNKKEICAVRGTVKASVLEGDPDIPNLVACSYYDQKPIYFLSTI